MNKQISNYLKLLRKRKYSNNGKKYTQDDLANDFSLNYNKVISNNAISEWESGKTIPSLENLEILSDIYGKTIDEILDGEDKKDLNLKEKYYIYDSNWPMNYTDGKYNLFQMRNEQIKLITSRFKELINIRIDRIFTYNEEQEFKFLFNNFYNISDYSKKIYEKDIDEYLNIKKAIYISLSKNRNMTKEEKYWEIQKLYIEKPYIQYSFRLDVYNLKNEQITQERFKEIDDWQKDMLLAMFQNIEPHDDKPDDYGARSLKRYEEDNGEYNHEKNCKEYIRLLIEGGACINSLFLNYKKIEKIKMRIIDKLEELYNICLKPLKISMVDEDGKVKKYKIENNIYNRFLTDYYFNLKYNLKGVAEDGEYEDIDFIYDWFVNNDTISDKVYLEIAKRNNIDTNVERKYWISELKFQNNIDKFFYEYKNKEKKIAEGLEEIKELKRKLEGGEKVYYEENEKIIGGYNEESIRKYIYERKSLVNYQYYQRKRDKKLTNELLKDIDKLSLDEIRKKYFSVEVIKNE